MLTSIVKGLIKFLPANSIAGIIADLLTKALSNIKDKEKLAKISAAVTATSTATGIVGEAVHDGTITEEEVNASADAIKEAVTKIIEAARS